MNSHGSFNDPFNAKSFPTTLNDNNEVAANDDPFFQVNEDSYSNQYNAAEVIEATKSDPVVTLIKSVKKQSTHECLKKLAEDEHTSQEVYDNLEIP